MKGIILLNGEPYEGKIEDGGALVYCCDGAYKWAAGKVHIDENIGDFDSLNVTPYPPPKKIYPEEKDFTDGEIAMRQMLKAGVSEVDIYGGGGMREDHFITNIHTMYYAYKRGVFCRMITNYSVMFFVGGEYKFKNLKGRTLSLLPFFGDCTVGSSSGLYYPLKNLDLKIGECGLGTSNVITEDEAYISGVKGNLLACIDCRKKGEIGG